MTNMMQLLHLLLSILLIINALQAQSCIEHERLALLKFKASVTDPNKQLASWSGDECCNWAGIRCDNQSGHVVHLDVRNNNYSYPIYQGKYVNFCLSGEISPFLIALSNLKYLDLSCNNFSGKFPAFLGSFENLEYLNVSYNILTGKVPPQFGNLSGLQYLDLSSNSVLYTGSDISWLSRLQSIRHLDMSYVDLNSSKEWVQSLNKLPSLEVLVLEENDLDYIPHSLSSVNFTSLTTLQLSDQNFNTTIPKWIFNITSLNTLDLRYSGFVGPIPKALEKLTSLSKLVLSGNPLEGTIPPLYNITKLTYLDLSGISIGEHMNVTNIPKSFSYSTWRSIEALFLQECNLAGTLKGWIDHMSSLKYLYLTFNNLTGPILDDIGNLTNLVELDLSGNSFFGSLTDAHLYQFSKLEALGLGDNPISISIKNNWQPSFSLRTLSLWSCKVGPMFPAWLQNQLKIQTLDLSNTQIDDVLPNWLWEFKSLDFLDISNNKITGKLPESMAHLTKLHTMLLNDNQFEGTVASVFPDDFYWVDLSNNRFQLWPKTLHAPGLSKFILTNNSLSGSIEFTLCRLTRLNYLDFSSNNLTGYLPNCLPSLQTLNLANNKIFGTIPRSMCSTSPVLNVLQIKNNNLTGSFPAALKFCKGLNLIDLGENHFHGEVPEWVGENLPLLKILSLRSNFFSGVIPSKLASLSYLGIIDLSYNQFSGQIPAHLENLTNMMRTQDTLEVYYYGIWTSTTKNNDLEYNLGDQGLYFRSIDLSNNNLTGEIPETIVALDGLLNLNLSNNHLTGKIPNKIGMMKSLESLDLHMNNLSGEIPESMSALNFLEVLNVSYNNLSGSIPTGPQLLSLDDPSIYMGNPYLCGPPLQKSCSDSRNYTDGNNNSNPMGSGDDKEKLWFYMSIYVGFVIGFLVAIFILLFKRHWRCAYF